MSIKEKLITIISESANVEVSSINENTKFVEDLNLDSLDIVEMVMKIEEEFGIEISEVDADKMSSVKNVIDFIKK